MKNRLKEEVKKIHEVFTLSLVGEVSNISLVKESPYGSEYNFVASSEEKNASWRRNNLSE